MSKEKVIVGKIGGEDWVSTNDGGVGRLLFKLQDAVEVKEGLNKAHEHAKELGCRLHGMEKENASLREALRLKELECEALAGNKEKLIGALERQIVMPESKTHMGSNMTVTEESISLLYNMVGNNEKQTS